MQSTLQSHLQLPSRQLRRHGRVAGPWQQSQQQRQQPIRRLALLRASTRDALPQQQHQQQAAAQHSPQPLADISLGAGRLAQGMMNMVTGKEDPGLAKKRREWQAKQDAEKAKEAAEQKEQQELQQQQAAAAAAAEGVLVDPLALADEAAAAEGAEAAVAAAEGAVAEGAAEAAAAEGAVAVPEAVAAAGERSIVSEYTEELVEEVPKTLEQRLVDARTFLTSTATGKGLGVAAGLFLGATLLIAMYRTWQKYSSPRAQRMRVIDKNKLLVAELSKYLPDKRADLTPAVVKKLRGSTGFSPVEVFRKYLWFLLRERQFDADAVEDMVLLKQALGLSDDEVAEALKERSQRIYDKYGTLMLNTDGMTPEGLERKATCRALFSKMLYLTEHEPLVAQGSEAFRVADLRTIFGATDEDADKLRIVSLYEMDLDRMESLMTGGAGAGAGGAAAAAAAAAEAAVEGQKQQQGGSSDSSSSQGDAAGEDKKQQ